MVARPPARPRSEPELAALCAELGAAKVGPLSAREKQLLDGASAVPDALITAARTAIGDGQDPLGESFSALRPPAQRRKRGATYTPMPIVGSMLGWAAAAAEPQRVIDPGVGSARFLVQAGRDFPAAELIGIEIDPLAALMARANLAMARLQDRARVQLADYRSCRPAKIDGTTLFVGNPPYLRHHEIAPRWKAWLTATAASYGLPASQLAGLHVHFFLATLDHARPGDIGAFITAANWLDVNYGKLVRGLLSGPLGLERMDILDPKVETFADAQTTAVITYFRVGSSARSVVVRELSSLTRANSLSGGTAVSRERLASSQRWSQVRRKRARPAELVELGELCRVHRGQVTGANAVWIASPDTPSLPRSVLRPTVTKARELFASAGSLRSAKHLRRVVDLPRDLATLSSNQRALVDAFLAWATAAGAQHSYTARHRSPWWAVKLRAPAPILATYMARRPPAFVRNLAEARYINIAHGLYPRDPLSKSCLDALAAYLGQSVSTGDGRSYAGGLTKFEPKEMERLLVPAPELLEELAARAQA